jgi:hypothetical protein
VDSLDDRKLEGFRVLWPNILVDFVCDPPQSDQRTTILSANASLGHCVRTAGPLRSAASADLSPNSRYLNALTGDLQSSSSKEQGRGCDEGRF